MGFLRSTVTGGQFAVTEPRSSCRWWRTARGVSSTGVCVSPLHGGWAEKELDQWLVIICLQPWPTTPLTLQPPLHPAAHPLKTFRNSLAALNLTPPRVQRVRSSGFVLNIVFCLLPSCPSPCCIFGPAVWLLSTFPRPALFIIPAFLSVHYGRWPPVFAEFSSDSPYRCSFSCPRPSALSGMDCKKQQIKGFCIVWAKPSKTE